MVGDGLNDAPALAAAYVSISPISAAHVAQAQADALFLGERLAPVADAVRISARARRLMVQNLWISAIYNADRGAARRARLRHAADRRARDVGLVGRGDAQCAEGARRERARGMNVLVYLVPVALALGFLGLAAFLWALRTRPVRRPRRRRLAGDQRRRPAGGQRAVGRRRTEPGRSVRRAPNSSLMVGFVSQNIFVADPSSAGEDFSAGSLSD